MGKPTAGPPRPLAWLEGIGPLRHVTGNIWEIVVNGYGRTLAGPYEELKRHLALDNLGEDAHHIVGREHLGDVPTEFTDADAPAVALERRLHNELVSSRITAEQNYLAGRSSRSSGRTRVSRRDVRSLYREVYTFHTPFRQLMTVVNHVLRTRPATADPATGLPARGVAARGTATAAATPPAAGTPPVAAARPDPPPPRQAVSRPVPRVAPDLRRPVLKFGKGMLADQLVSLTIGMLVQRFEMAVQAQNLERLRIGWRGKVEGKVAPFIDRQIRRSLAGEFAGRRLVLVELEWTLELRELREDAADVVVWAFKFGYGDPGFGEVYHDVRLERVPDASALHFRPRDDWCEGRDANRRTAHVNDYTFHQFVLVHDELALQVARTLRGAADRLQRALDAALGGWRDAVVRIEPPAGLVAELRTALDRCHFRHAAAALAALAQAMDRDAFVSTASARALVPAMAKAAADVQAWRSLLSARRLALLAAYLGAPLEAPAPPGPAAPAWQRMNPALR